MVAAALARSQAGGGRVRGNRYSALRADEQGDDHEVFAIGNRAGLATWRARGLGQLGDLRVPRRVVPDVSAMAAGSRRACGGAIGLRRIAFGFSGSARPSADERAFELPQSRP